MHIAKYTEVEPSYKNCHSVAYAENFRGGGRFRHNRVTSQINFGEVPKARPFSGSPGACPQENFANLHLKIRIFVHSGSKF